MRSPAGSGPGHGPHRIQEVAPGTRDEPVEVARTGGPGDQRGERGRTAAEPQAAGRPGLFGIGADDLEVDTGTDPEQGVARPQPRMAAARREGDAETRLDVMHTEGEVGDRVDEVVGAGGNPQRRHRRDR